jgi:hypothetical protein
MTRKEYDNFCEILESRGYKKHSSPRCEKDEYAWYKAFGESEHEENRSNYQMCFDVFDFSEFAYRDKHIADSPFSVSPTVLVSRSADERIDLHLSFTGYEKTDVDALEELAASFFNWVVSNCPIPKEK